MFHKNQALIILHHLHKNCNPKNTLHGITLCCARPKKSKIFHVSKKKPPQNQRVDNYSTEEIGSLG